MNYLSCLASFLVIACVSYSDSTLVYVYVRDPYPQNAWVSHYCPGGTMYSRHVCGSGASRWRGRTSVQYGPYSSNKYLTDNQRTDRHCSCCCNCNLVTVECRVLKTTTTIPPTTTTIPPTTTTTEMPITAKAVHLDCSDQDMRASFNESYFPAPILNITIRNVRMRSTKCKEPLFTVILENVRSKLQKEIKVSARKMWWI